MASLRPTRVLFDASMFICWDSLVLFAEKLPPLHVPKSKVMVPVPRMVVSLEKPPKTRGYEHLLIVLFQFDG